MMTTVLPTPAPPNRPILPPFKNGWIRSMTFTPVSNISISVDCSSNAGAWRWMGLRLAALTGPKLVHRVADDVEHAAQRFAAHGHGDGAAQVDGLHAAHHAFGGLHGDAAHAAFAELLLHFQDDVDGLWER